MYYLALIRNEYPSFSIIFDIKFLHQLIYKPTQVSFDSISTITQATRNIWLFPSLPIIAKSSPLTKPSKKQPSNPITFLQPAKNLFCNNQMRHIVCQIQDSNEETMVESHPYSMMCFLYYNLLTSHIIHEALHIQLCSRHAAF